MVNDSFFHDLEGLDESDTLKTNINFVSGSVEAACALGLADGIGIKFPIDNKWIW